MLKGIDVSDVQKIIDWPTVKRAGLDFAMLKCGYGNNQSNQDEDYFRHNVSECERLGIPWGAYLYSYAMSEADAPGEVQHVKRVLSGLRPSYPVIIDMEDADGYKARHGGIPAPQVITDILKAELSALEGAGYYAGWYANKDWCLNHLCSDQLSRWLFWYARPGVSSPDRPCGIWQNQQGETGGRWPGVNGSCDLDISYNDYAAVIKKAGLNGWKVTTAPAANPPYACDTSGTVEIARGAAYQALITSAQPVSIAVGTPDVITMLHRHDDGNKRYYWFVPIGRTGQEAGVYINGVRQFICKVK
jgi:GH25 family lysozyme M1 (1,4-beta-N-acetylmuramidase)